MYIVKHQLDPESYIFGYMLLCTNQLCSPLCHLDKVEGIQILLVLFSK